MDRSVHRFVRLMLLEQLLCCRTWQTDLLHLVLGSILPWLAAGVGQLLELDTSTWEQPMQMVHIPHQGSMGS